VVPSGNGHRLKHRRFSLNVKKHIFTVGVTEHWNRLFIEQDLVQLNVISNRILQT